MAYVMDMESWYTYGGLIYPALIKQLGRIMRSGYKVDTELDNMMAKQDEIKHSYKDNNKSDIKSHQKINV